MNNNSKLLWLAIALSISMVVVGVGGKILVDRIADRVIQKLQKDYSPSPYGPGIDPDKLDMEKLKNSNINVSQDKAWGKDWNKNR
jgi:hypothetical protein